MNAGKPVLTQHASWAAATIVSVLCVLLPVSRGPMNAAAAGSAGTADASEECAMRTPVLVVGGTPSGVAAAVSAARAGTPVYLTEARPYLGGDLTGAMVNTFDMDVGPAGNDLAQGVFWDIYKQLGMTFDVRVAKRVFREEVRREPLITLKMRTRPIEVRMHGPWVAGVTFQDAQHMRYTVCAKRIVDATDDADIAAMAGAPYAIGREDSGIDRAMMSATLVFELRGVNRRHVVTYVDGRSERHIRHVGVYRGNVWGYHHILRRYEAAEPGIAIYDLNIGLQNDHTVLINGLQVFDVDGTNPASVADGMHRATAELPRLIRFLRQWAPGFATAELTRTADYLYIRETRHIRGLYTMTAADIVNGRVFWDAIGVASYPIDLHPYKSGEFNPYAPKRFVYTIPFRALVPRGTANLIMASRSISATYAAAASLRVVPTTMEEGQAAGIAAALSLQHRISVPRFAEQPPLIHDLQAALSGQRAFLPPETLASIGRGEPPRPERARFLVPTEP